MLRCTVIVPPQSLAGRNEQDRGQEIEYRLRMILAVPGAKNPCENRKKYVKYLLTK
jgi:hypothetical protein